MNWNAKPFGNPLFTEEVLMLFVDGTFSHETVYQIVPSHETFNPRPKLYVSVVSVSNRYFVSFLW